MNEIIFVGIDPGFGGAIGFIIKRTAIVKDIPVFTNDKNKKFYDVSGIRDIFLPYIEKDLEVMIELVHAMPKQGVSSTFRFGEGFGIMQGVIIGLGFNLSMVSPQKWKRELFGKSETTKEDSRAKALELFPKLGEDLRRKMDEGRAEAILIAEYGRRKYIQEHKQKKLNLE